jgi:hypothetical protein
MTDPMLLATAGLLGLQHALEVDHLVAVTTFVSRRPALRSAAGFGARWGLGHALAVCLFGGTLLLTGIRVPARLEALGEAVVGVMLVGLGVWALRTLRRLHAHADGSLMVHARGAPQSGRAHAHASLPEGAGVTWVGLTHGLAGTSAVIAIIPVTLLGSVPLGLGYLAAFGLGTMAAMTGAAVAAALAMRRAQRVSLAWARGVTTLVGAAATGVGLWWVVRATLGVFAG